VGTDIDASKFAKGSGQRRNPLFLNTAQSMPKAAPWQRGTPNLHILPLVKVPGTPFVDLITLGRTTGNDIRVDDHSVSRFHAFFRQRLGHWYLCDSGSKNGTRVAGKQLAPRTEAKLQNRDLIHFGSVEASFYGSDALFDLLTQGE
jgi:pSer/pThr/pTyr-binding forkhead associated (FHA) protein